MLIAKRKIGIFDISHIFFLEDPASINFQDSDIVTYHTYKNFGKMKGFERKKYFTTRIDLNPDVDVIWSKIKRHHKRHIRRAKKNEINVSVSNDFEEFYKISKRISVLNNHAYPFNLNIYSSKFIQKYGIQFIAENENKVLGRNLYFHDNHNAVLIDNVYLNNRENKKLSIDANCLLHWEAMQHFKNLGIINYDLGEVQSNDVNINHQMSGGEFFKRNFGGYVSSKYEYRKFKSPFIKYIIKIMEKYQFENNFT
jgi:lipid II:glycine glycyltransferase (peptidoglycan interpeptide bridge formation enzyme)